MLGRRARMRSRWSRCRSCVVRWSPLGWSRSWSCFVCVASRRMLRRRRFVVVCRRAVAKWFRARAGGDVRPAVIHGREHCSVGARCSLMFHLCRSHRNVPLMSCGKLSSRRPGLHATSSAIKADTIDGPAAIDHISGVSVMNNRGVRS
jgi:hypothetical protein